MFCVWLFIFRNLFMGWDFRFSRWRVWRWLVFWDVASCSVVKIDQRFRGTHCLHSLMMEAISTFETLVISSDYTTQHPSRHICLWALYIECWVSFYQGASQTMYGFLLIRPPGEEVIHFRNVVVLIHKDDGQSPKESWWYTFCHVLRNI
jgi:hypothetical protein